MNAVQPAAKEGAQLRLKSGNRKVWVLTQVLEEFAWVLELDMEVPASTERTHGGLRPVALPADHADLGSIRSIRQRTGYAKEREGGSTLSSSSKTRTYFSGSSS